MLNQFFYLSSKFLLNKKYKWQIIRRMMDSEFRFADLSIGLAKT